MGKSYGKILQENLVGKSCGKFLQEILAGNAAGNAVGNLVGNLLEKVLMVCTWSKNGKKTTNIGNFWHLWEILKPITSTKTL